MKGNSKNVEKAKRVELKYCEHCGGLWVRECGAGIVYCENCRPLVADLPTPKKPQRVILPVRGQTAVEDYGIEEGAQGETDLDAAGGAA